jgi:hypothetical protein
MENDSQTEIEPIGRAKGGIARAESLTAERRSEIARNAALTRFGKAPLPDGELPKAIGEGLLRIGDVDLECYVLADRRRVFHKRGMAKALRMKSGGGNVFMRTLSRKGLGSVIPEELRAKFDNPIVFRPLNGDPAHGYEGIALIELCDAIWEARKLGKLTKTQEFLGVQAEIIMRSSAKIGIIALIDEATGFILDKRREQYRELFREFIRAEFATWKKEFPDEFFDMLYRLYNLKRNAVKYRHPRFFGKFIRRYIYAPLANSNGAILEMLDEKNPVAYTNGGRRYAMTQFLSDVVGLNAFRAHLWKTIGIGSAARTKEGFDRAFSLAFPQAGSQGELFDTFTD